MFSVSYAVSPSLTKGHQLVHQVTSKLPVSIDPAVRVELVGIWEILFVVVDHIGVDLHVLVGWQKELPYFYIF